MSVGLPIQDAFKAFAVSLGLSEAITEGTPMDAWLRIQTELAQRPKKRRDCFLGEA